MGNCMKRPYLIIYSTITVDGKIASRTRFSKLSCRYDLIRLNQLRAESDAVMIGANTLIIDDPSLTLKFVEGNNPDRIVVDGKLRSPISARIFLTPPKTIILTTQKALTEKIEKLREKGVDVLILGEGSTINMRQAMSRLYSIGYRKIMVEGGGELLWSLFKTQVVDEVWVTIAPFVFGGRNAVSLVMGEGFRNTEEAVKLEPYRIEKCKCKKEVHIKYRVVV